MFPFSSSHIPAGVPSRVSSWLVGSLTSLTVAAVLSALPVASAQAATTGTCPSAVTSQPFLKWGDSNQYKLVEGGDFEGSSSIWAFTGEAGLAAGSEPYAVTGKLGASSLTLPAGASAQSPFMCVTEVDRTFRFFVRREGTTASTVVAEVVYKTLLGSVAALAGTILPSGTWAPSAILHTGAALAVSNGTAQLALRFKSLSGTARVDDVYLDPRMR